MKVEGYNCKVLLLAKCISKMKLSKTLKSSKKIKENKRLFFYSKNRVAFQTYKKFIIINCCIKGELLLSY